MISLSQPAKLVLPPQHLVTLLQKTQKSNQNTNYVINFHKNRSCACR
jgi:hypothetical protein